MVSSRAFIWAVPSPRCILPARHAAQQRHHLHTATVTEADVLSLASKQRHRLTLNDLVKHGRPPLSAQALYRSANFTLSILPARLAQRIQSLRDLPYIVVTNPNIAKIHSNYLHSLSTLLPWAERDIADWESADEFAEVMGNIVETHAETIPVLARGLLEARKYIAPKEVARFLDRHLRARIGTRLLAEQHLALHHCSIPWMEAHGRGADDIGGESDPMASFIGVIDTKLSPSAVMRHCEGVVGDVCEFKYGVRPHIVLNGDLDYTFAQIQTHLEYIVTELLKNAFRATIERKMEKEPIEVTIAPLPESPRPLENKDPDTDGTTTDPTPGVTIRIRDRGGGISPQNYKHIWDYSFTTFNEDQIQSTISNSQNAMDGLNAISDNGGSSLAGLGYGLPLSRAYAEYFGGGIAVQSMWGWGTDVYLSLRGVGKIEGVQ